MIAYVAQCLRCGETFCPADANDLIHVARNDGAECGGTGEMKGTWS